MCVYVYACVHVAVRIGPLLYIIYIYIYIYIVYIYICILYICILHLCMRACGCAYRSACAAIYMCVCMYVSASACLHVYSRMHTYMLHVSVFLLPGFFCFSVLHNAVYESNTANPTIIVVRFCVFRHVADDNNCGNSNIAVIRIERGFLSFSDGFYI